MNPLENYVLIIGSSNMDLNIYSERLPKPGETVTGGTFKQFLGGKGANQAIASVRSGAKTMFIAKIGQDSFGDQMISQLGNEGIRIANIIRDTDEASGVAFILIDRNGENMISVAPGANSGLRAEEITTRGALIKNARVLVVQMEIPVETIEEIFSIASEGNVIKVLNPAPLKEIPPSILRNVDIIIPNEGELFRLYSLLDFKEIPNAAENKVLHASKQISKLGINVIITTLGKNGCVIYQSDKDNFTKIPAYPVEAVDTVGAGDCFNGVLASMLNQGKSLIESAKYATAAASIAVTRKGAQESMPYEEEIERRYGEFIKFMHNGEK